MTDLKPLPCPICGDEPEVAFREADMTHEIYCEVLSGALSDGEMSHCVAVFHRDNVEAIREWNRRFGKKD